MTPAVRSDGGVRRPQRLGAALRHAWIGYRRRLETELAGAGFESRFPDARVLRICTRDPDATIADIGRELGLTRQGAAKIVAGLRDGGYLVLDPSATSGREKQLVLTSKARSYLQAQRRAARRIEADLREEVGEDAFAALYRLLDLLGAEEQPRLREYLRKTHGALPEPVE
jgi:DNA-binding MarR family transcriptional regulator